MVGAAANLADRLHPCMGPNKTTLAGGCARAFLHVKKAMYLRSYKWAIQLRSIITVESQRAGPFFVFIQGVIPRFARFKHTYAGIVDNAAGPCAATWIPVALPGERGYPAPEHRGRGSTTRGTNKF